MNGNGRIEYKEIFRKPRIIDSEAGVFRDVLFYHGGKGSHLQIEQIKPSLP